MINIHQLVSKLRLEDVYVDNIQFERDFSEEEREFLIQLVLAS